MPTIELKFDIRAINDTAQLYTRAWSYGWPYARQITRAINKTVNLIVQFHRTAGQDAPLSIRWRFACPSEYHSTNMCRLCAD